MKKRGQQTMGMPFNMIFAIFLIIVFFVIAFIAIGFFLDLGKGTSVGLFYDDLQKAVDDAWSGQSSEADFKIDLPKGITTICFADLKGKITAPLINYPQIRDYEVYDANTFLIPPEKAESMQWKFIKHLNISIITEDKNPYCVSVEQGLRIKKDFYAKSVVVR